MKKLILIMLVALPLVLSVGCSSTTSYQSLRDWDEVKLKNILSALFVQLEQMQEKLEMQDDKAEQYQVFLYKSLQNIETEKISNPEDKPSISRYQSAKALRMKHELAVLDRLHINLMREQYVQLKEIAIDIIGLYVLQELNNDDYRQFLDGHRQFLEDWENL